MNFSGLYMILQCKKKAYKSFFYLTQANDSYYSFYSLQIYGKKEIVSCGVAVIKYLRNTETTDSKTLICISNNEIRKEINVLCSDWILFNLFLCLWDRDQDSLYVQVMHTLWRINKYWKLLFLACLFKIILSFQAFSWVCLFQNQIILFYNPVFSFFLYGSAKDIWD